MNESQHNINRPSETEFVNSGSFSLSRYSIIAATSRLNPTYRQYSIAANAAKSDQEYTLPPLTIIDLIAQNS